MTGRLLKLCLLLAAASLAACSTGTKLAYNNLDTLLKLEVASYVDLEKPQKAMLEREFKPIWDWHRSHELPHYAEMLRALATVVEQGNPDAAVIEQAIREVEASTERLQQQASPALARLLADLSDAQVAELLAKIDEELDEREADASDDSPEQRRERLARKSLQRIDDWLGRVLPAQRELTTLRVAAAEARGVLDPTKQRAKGDRERQQFAAVLATRKQPGFAARLIALDEPQDAAEQAERAAGRERVRSYFVALSPTLDARQRAHLAKHLRNFASDFDTLAAQAPQAAPPPADGERS